MLSKNTEAKRLLTGHSEINSHVVVGNLLIHGNGLFTDANLEAGTVLFNILAERTRYENNIEMAKLNPNWIGAGYKEWLMVNPGEVGSYLNHSCSPNLILNEQDKYKRSLAPFFIQALQKAETIPII